MVNNRLARMTPYNLYDRSSIIASYNGTQFASFFMIGEAIFSHYVDFLMEKKQILKNNNKEDDKES
nr:hypothetical protein [Thermoactinomyces mirandus]